MIYGNINETQTEQDLTMELLVENYILKNELIQCLNNELLNEAANGVVMFDDTSVKASAVLAYGFRKWKNEKRTIEQIKKDIEHCDKLIKSLDSEIKKYDDSPTGTKITNTLVHIISKNIPYFSWLTSSSPHTISLFGGGGKGTGLIKGSSIYQKYHDKKLKSIWESYKSDLLLCKKETENTKEYLEGLLKKSKEDK